MFKKAIFGAITILLMGAQFSWAATVTVAWDANTESDLAGYKLFYGTTSRTQGAYAQTVVINNKSATNWVLTLSPATYFFALKAFDTSGNESAFSVEVSATVPDAALPGKPGKPTLIQ